MALNNSRVCSLNRNVNAAVDISGNTTIAGNAKKGKEKLNKVKKLTIKKEIKEKQAARNLDRAAGLDETEADIARLQEIAAKQIADAEAAERAKQAIEEANRYGKSQFETLLEIASDNGINTESFLTACGFKSPDELRDNPEFCNALVNWGMAVGKFDKNNIVYGKFDGENNFVEGTGEGCYPVFVGNPVYDKDGKLTSNEQLSVAVETIASMLTMFGYVDKCDMVSLEASPYFIDMNGNVSTSEEYIDYMFQKLTVNGVSEEDWELVYNNYAGLYNGNNQFFIDQIIREEYVQPNVKSVRVTDANGNVSIKQELVYQDRNFDAMYEYLVNLYGGCDFLDCDEVRDKFGEIEAFDLEEKRQEFYRDLYEIYFSTHGLSIISDKNGSGGYSVLDLTGKKISNGSNIFTYDTEYSEIGTFIHLYLMEHNEDYRRNEEENYGALYEGANLLSTNKYIKQIGELYQITSGALTGWRAVVNPFINIGTGIVEGVEPLIDTGAYIGGAMAAGSAYEQSDDYMFYAAIMRLFGWDDLAKTFDETSAMMVDQAESVLDSTKVFIAKDLAQELKDYADKCGWATGGDLNKVFQDIGKVIPEIVAGKYKPIFKAVSSFGQGLESGYQYYQNKYYQAHPDEDPSLNAWVDETNEFGVLSTSVLNASVGYIIGTVQGKLKGNKNWQTMGKKFGYNFGGDLIRDVVADFTTARYKGYVLKDRDGNPILDKNGNEQIDWNQMLDAIVDQVYEDAVGAFTKVAGSDLSDKSQRGFLSEEIKGRIKYGGEKLSDILKGSSAGVKLAGFMGSLLDESEKAVFKRGRKMFGSFVSDNITQPIIDTGIETEQSKERKEERIEQNKQNEEKRKQNEIDEAADILYNIIDNIDLATPGETIEMSDCTVVITEDGFEIKCEDGSVYKGTYDGEDIRVKYEPVINRSYTGHEGKF